MSQSSYDLDPRLDGEYFRNIYIAFLSEYTSTPKKIYEVWYWIDNGYFPGNDMELVHDRIFWKKYLT